MSFTAHISPVFWKEIVAKKKVYDDLAEANHAVATATQRVLQPDIIVDGGHGLAVPLGAETLH